MKAANRPIILAGIPGHNAHVYRRIRFNCHDTVVFIALPKSGGGGNGAFETFAIMRPIEIDRARQAMQPYIDEATWPVEEGSS